MATKIELFEPASSSSTYQELTSFYVEDDTRELIQVSTGVLGPKGDTGAGVGDHLVAPNPHPQYLKTIDETLRAYGMDCDVSLGVTEPDVEEEQYGSLRAELGFSGFGESEEYSTELSPLGVESKSVVGGQEVLARLSGNSGIEYLVKYDDSGARYELNCTPFSIGMQWRNNNGDTSIAVLSPQGMTAQTSSGSGSEISNGRIASSRVSSNVDTNSSAIMDGTTGIIQVGGPAGGARIDAPQKNIVFSRNGLVKSTYSFADNTTPEVIASREWVGTAATPIAHTNTSGNKHAATNISTTAVTSGAVSVPAGTVQSAIQSLAMSVNGATGGVKVGRLTNTTLPTEGNGGVYLVKVDSVYAQTEYPMGSMTPEGFLVSNIASVYGGGKTNTLTFISHEGDMFVGTRNYVVPTESIWAEIDGEIVEQTPSPYWQTPTWTRVAPVLSSPNGTRYRLTVANNGTLGTQAL